MTTPLYPTTWYWVVSDTNPTTQVWESSSGSFVSNSAANYQSWVANGGRSTNGPAQVNVLGAANNGSGVVRLTVDKLQDMATNDKWVVQNVGGTVEANGTQTIIVVSSVAPFTIDLQGVAFVHAYTSGGVADRGTLIDTAADLYDVINRYNVGLARSTFSSVSSGVNLSLSNPLAEFTNVLMSAAGLTLTLPQMNLFGSVPIGVPFYLHPTAACNRFLLNDFSGNNFSVENALDNVGLILLTNSTQNGTIARIHTPVHLFTLKETGAPDAAIPIVQSDQFHAVWNPITGDFVINDAGVGALKNIPNDTPMAGDLLVTEIAAPSAPAAGQLRIYGDSTSNNLAAINHAGTVNHGVQTKAAIANQFFSGVADDGSWSVGALRGYLAGLTLSNDGVSPNTVIDISAGVACSDDFTTMMNLAAFTKTTGAWAVGSGNGGLDTGSVANSTWYHVFVIERTDTGVVDALISTSATAPTMPANYTKKRRIGSFLTDGSAHIIAFVQDGDVFRWAAPVDDSSGGFANPGTAAVTRTLTVPTGVQVFADMNIQAVNTGGTSAPASIYMSDLALPDQVAGAPNATVAVRVQTLGAPTILVIGLPCSIRTNTSAQVRSRLSISDAGTTLFISTLGWTDRRGAR